MPQEKRSAMGRWQIASAPQSIALRAIHVNRDAQSKPAAGRLRGY